MASLSPTGRHASRAIFSLACALTVCYGSVAEYNETEAYRQVQWAMASYCCGSLGSGADEWTCPTCAGQVTNVRVVSDATTNANGFVMLDVSARAAGEIVVAFAGTDPLSIRNWIDDIDTFKTDYPCENCSVHEGFYHSWASVAQGVRDAVTDIATVYPDAIVRVTGHSLGAAIAVLAALDLATMATAAAAGSAAASVTVGSIYTFGQPRVGNMAFERFFGATFADVPAFRVTHYKDPVPHLPLEAMGFHHTAREVYYAQWNNDYTVCDGSGEDGGCSNKHLVDLSVPDHLTYLKQGFTENYIRCKL